MTGPDEGAGQSADVVPELESQGQVMLQRDVCPASEVRGEMETVRETGGSTEAAGSEPHRSERLHLRQQQEIPDVVEGNEVEAIVPGYLVGAK